MRTRRTWHVSEKPKGPLARIRAYLLQDTNQKPVTLNPKETELHLLLNKCWGYMANGYERRDVVRLLILNDEVSERNAHNIITSTLKLYGDIYKSSLDGVKAIERENYIRIARKCEEAAGNETDGHAKAKLMMVATRSRELASKIAGTFEIPEEKKQTVILPAILLTSDKSAIEKSNPIDISHDEDEDAV